MSERAAASGRPPRAGRRAIAHAWRAWVELLDRREPATALALVRIFVALALLGDLALAAHHGLIDALWSKAPAGFARAHASWPEALGIGAHGLYALAIGALACIAIGLATRAACVAFVLVSAQLSQLQPDEGIDNLLRIAIAILALSRCNARWSIDAWIARRLGRPMPATVPAWPRILLVLQLLWVYFSAAHNKGHAEWWPNGGFTALSHTLADPHWARFPGAWIATFDPLARIATVLVVTFELCAPLYLVLLYYAATPERPGRLRRWCNRVRARWLWLVLGASLHLGIAVFMKLGMFPWGVLALYPALVFPDDLERAERRLRQRRNTPAPANRAASPS
jgi:hypothetical protein